MSPEALEVLEFVVAAIVGAGLVFALWRARRPASGRSDGVAPMIARVIGIVLVIFGAAPAAASIRDTYGERHGGRRDTTWVHERADPPSRCGGPSAVRRWSTTRMTGTDGVEALLTRAREMVEALRDPGQMPADRRAVADALDGVLDAIGRAARPVPNRQRTRRRVGATTPQMAEIEATR